MGREAGVDLRLCEFVKETEAERVIAFGLCSSLDFHKCDEIITRL